MSDDAQNGSLERPTTDTSVNAEQPLVSVIVPVYNSQQYVGEALRSAISQDYLNYEIIVVDDGSTDGTPEVLAGFGDQIRAERQDNSGAAAARNLGLRLARGEYIAFLDSDDVWLPGKLGRQVAYLESHREVGLVWGDWIRWYQDRVPPVDWQTTRLQTTSESYPPIVAENSGWIYHKLLMDCIVWTSTVLLRTSVVRQIGVFDEELRRGQDYDYWLRAARVCQMHKLDEVMALYRIHEASVTHNPKSVDYASLVVERAVRRWGLKSPNGQALSRREYRARRAQLLFDWGYSQSAGGAQLAALRSYVRSLRYRPIWPAPWRQIVKVLSRVLISHNRPGG